MVLFHNDYSEGCHEAVMEKLVQTNLEQTPGYGEDAYCTAAAEMIRKKCGREDVYVQFLVGGTQANMTVIAAALRHHQGAVCADSGHIHVHETGAVEATGHKCIALPSHEGKISAAQHVVGSNGRLPCQSPEPCQKFPARKGLGQIIVGTGV